MGLKYFKRYRMEIDLRAFDRPLRLPPGYRFVPWRADRLEDHIESMYLSFCDELDSTVFECLATEAGCRKLMTEIARKPGFVPEATWLVEYVAGPHKAEYCGTIQGVKISSKLGAIQNVGVTPLHRGRGLGAGLVAVALMGFRQIGLPKAGLEVTASNRSAVQMYERIGFRRVKTLYKSVKLAYS